MQVAGRAAGGGDDRVAGSSAVVEDRRSACALAHRRSPEPASASVAQRPPRLLGGARPLAPRASRGGVSRVAARNAASASLASPTTGVAPCLRASRSADVDRREPHVRIREHRLRAGREVGRARVPTCSTRSASAASALAAGLPSSPTPPSRHQTSCWTAPLPAKVSTTGIPSCSASAASSRLRLGVQDAAAGDDQRPLGVGDQRRDGRDRVGMRRRDARSSTPAARRTRPGSRRPRPGCPAAGRSSPRPSPPGR